MGNLFCISLKNQIDSLFRCPSMFPRLFHDYFSTVNNLATRIRKLVNPGDRIWDQLQLPLGDEVHRSVGLEVKSIAVAAQLLVLQLHDGACAGVEGGRLLRLSLLSVPIAFQGDALNVVPELRRVKEFKRRVYTVTSSFSRPYITQFWLMARVSIFPTVFG